MRRALIALALVVGTIVPATAALAADDGSFGIRLVDAPTDRRGDPRAETAIVDHLRPGEVIQRRIEVVSDHDEPIDVMLAPGAAQVRDGEFLAVDEGDGHELPDWVGIDPSRLTLQPGERQMAMVTVTVPADASEGERYGVVWAAVGSDPDDGAITRVNRVGVRLYLSIGAGEEPVSDFEITELVPGRAASQPVVEARVENTGGRALDIGGDLELDEGPGGISAGPFERSRGTTVEPGDSGTVVFALPEDLPEGPWQATTRLRSGTLERVAQARLSFADALIDEGVPVEHAGSDPRWPAIAIATGLLLLVALLLVLVVLARRRRDDEDEDVERVAAAVQEPADV